MIARVPLKNGDKLMCIREGGKWFALVDCEPVLIDASLVANHEKLLHDLEAGYKAEVQGS